MAKNRQWVEICFEAMLEYIPEDFTTAEITERFRSIAAHIESIGGFLYAESTTNDNVAKFFSMAGIGHKEISNYEIALDYYFKAVSIREKNNNEQALGLVYNNIAVIYNIKAMYKPALEYSHKSIKISEKLNAPKVDLIKAYNNLASIYLQCTAYNDALDWNTKALKIAEDSLLTNEPICADVYLMRSAVHYACEEFEDALKLDFKALGISQNHYPEEHADIGAAYNSIAREYFSLKQYAAALENYLKVEKIYGNVYGEDDSDTAEVYGSIAMTYIKLEEYGHALEWCLKALESQKKVLGAEHPETILRHSILSEIYEHLGVYEEAIIHLIQIRNFYVKNGQAEIVRIVNERISKNYEKLGNHLESSKYRNMDMTQGGSDE